MKNITIVSRADDLGSSRSANAAIEQVIRGGFIRNVSVMACGPEIEDAAKRLAGNPDVCFGMHTTLNAEWDRVKWGPVRECREGSGLLDENGYFLPDPQCFLETKPQVETIMEEVAAQLSKLRKLGFDIRYIDSHMFPEMFVPGLDAAMEAFIREQGLLDHMYFYNLSPAGIGGLFSPEIWPDDGQYFWVSHPSLDTEEMRMTGNGAVPGELVAKSRAAEKAMFADADFCEKLRKLGIRGIRYDEAKIEKRMTVAELAAAMAGGK